MQYGTLIEEIFTSIPELKAVYDDKAEEDSIDEETGVHVVFGLIIAPYVIELLRNQTFENINILKRTFSFFERMACCDDTLVQEVLAFTIIEDLIEEGREILNLAYDYMLGETRETSTLVERFFDI